MLQWLIEIILDMKQKFLSWLSPWLSENELSWINEHFIWIVIIVVIIIWRILAFIYSSRKLKKRAENLKEFNPQKLFHSLPNENVISKFREPSGVIQLWHNDYVYGCFLGRGAMNLTEGNMGSIDFVTYDYEYTFDDKTFRGTAILLQSDQLVLPSFKWDRKGVQPGSPQKQKKKQVPNNVQHVVAWMSGEGQRLKGAALVTGALIAKNLFTK